jgi:hypothetical protein
VLKAGALPEALGVEQMSIRLPVLAPEWIGPLGVWMRRLISVLSLRSVAMEPSISSCTSGMWLILLGVA